MTAIFDGRAVDFAFQKDLAALHRAYAGLREAFDRDGGPAVAVRRETLRALRAAIKRDAEAYAAAISDDFGIRSRHETLLAEIAVIIDAIDYSVARIGRWAAPSRPSLGWRFWPAHGRILKQPRGVAGVIAPGNYPLHLALLPAIAALAAGCRVLVKPSELTPRTAELMQTSIAAAIDPKILSVVLGDASVSSAMTHLPLDVLLFTGSERVGHLVMGAAAQNLTPVILELGGKSPVIIDRGADLTQAAEAIISGKLMNAGQTCVAPDYVLVPREIQDQFIEKLRTAAAKLYPDTRDYTSVASETARRRLQALEAGLDVVPLFGAPVAAPHYRPALVLSPPLDSAIMQEEIFGPLLPLLLYDTLDEAIGFVRARPKPLVLYWFGKNQDTRDDALAKTASGSAVVNDTVLQVAIQSLPFGGVGRSGMGRYHGKAGFDAFTHERPVLYQARFSPTVFLRPPFGKITDLILKFLTR